MGGKNAGVVPCGSGGGHEGYVGLCRCKMLSGRRSQQTCGLARQPRLFLFLTVVRIGLHGCVPGGVLHVRFGIPKKSDPYARGTNVPEKRER